MQVVQSATSTASGPGWVWQGISGLARELRLDQPWNFPSQVTLGRICCCMYQSWSAIITWLISKKEAAWLAALSQWQWSLKIEGLMAESSSKHRDPGTIYQLHERHMRWSSWSRRSCLNWLIIIMGRSVRKWLYTKVSVVVNANPGGLVGRSLMSHNCSRLPI